MYTIALYVCFLLLHEALCHGLQKYWDPLLLSSGTLISDVLQSLTVIYRALSTSFACSYQKLAKNLAIDSDNLPRNAIQFEQLIGDSVGVLLGEEQEHQ